MVQLDQLARASGKDNASELVKDLALHFLQDEAEFQHAVREGVAQADRGELLDEQEMDERVARLLNR